MSSRSMKYNLKNNSYLSWSRLLVLSVLMTGICGMSPLSGDETNQQKSANIDNSNVATTADEAVKPSVTMKEEETYLEFPEDVTEMFNVTFAPKLKRLNNIHDESRFVYSVPVTLENVSSGNIPGPVRLVILSTGKKGLRIINEDGLIVNSNEEYTEFHAAGKLVRKSAKSKPRTLTFASKTELKPEEFSTEKMVWRITREEGETWSEILNRKKGKLGDDDKLLADKEYSRAELRQAMNTQEEYTEKMYSDSYEHKDKMIKEIFGTGITEDKSGQPAMVVYVARLGLENIFPKQIDGMNVIVEVTEPFRAGPAGAGQKSASGAAISPLPDDLEAPFANPRSRFPRPVPIGVSIANISESCYSGTLGFRGTVVGTTNKVIVTNNHVIGEENSATVGEKVNQPSTGDVVPACTKPAADEVGQVRLVIPIIFSTSAENLVDAAMANTTDLLVDSKTPTDDGGYGYPETTPVDPVVGMRVMKYGRTSAFKKGTITSINSTFSVGYDKGPARFVRQITVGPEAGVSLGQPGDSGSLIVSESQRQPVALLFAGSGTTTQGNPIKEVLRLLNVTVDGAPVAPPPPPPTANGSIGDFVFNDANDDGQQSAGETGISGIGVKLLKVGTDNIIGTADDVLVKSTTTSGDGKYAFENLEDGAYHVQFILPVGRKFAKQNIGSDTTDSDANVLTGITPGISIASGNKVTNVDCGLLTDTAQAIGRIGNFVWLDANRNGRQEFLELGQEGVTVELLDSTERVIKTTTTNKRGFYIFEQLSPGTYAVRFRVANGIAFSPANVGSDYRDSDANPETGRTEFFTLQKGRLDFSRDCGVYRTN